MIDYFINKSSLFLFIVYNTLCVEWHTTVSQAGSIVIRNKKKYECQLITLYLYICLELYKEKKKEIILWIF